MNTKKKYQIIAECINLFSVHSNSFFVRVFSLAAAVVVSELGRRQMVVSFTQSLGFNARKLSPV